jgi:hypothetical protein
MTTPNHGVPTWLKSILATGALVAALALLVAAVGLSSPSSIGSMPGAAEPWATTTILATYTNPSPITTPTPGPSRDTTGPMVVVIATAAPPPFTAPEPKPTPFPTCPAATDKPDLECFYSPPLLTPTPFPTPTPLATCDDLRTAVATGAKVAPAWCKETPDGG